MALRLIIEDEEGATTIVPLGEEEVTIGREPGNTIQLTEQNVSRQHARLTQSQDGWVIEDLDSYNGVKVNGVLVEGSVTLNEGDVVQIGDYHLALSNNVEQTTLNIERPGQAANEPNRMTPSVDLPKISAAEAAGLSTPNYAPANDIGRPRDDDREGGSNRGLLFGLGLVALLGLGFVAFKFLGNDGTRASNDEKGVRSPAGLHDSTEPPIKAVSPELVPTPEPDPPEVKDPTTAPGPDLTTGEPEDVPVETPTKKVVKPVVPKLPVDPKPKVPKPEVPKGDPVALLEDARKASLAGNATQAYDLARKSYDVDRNVSALQLMGVSACKMGDTTKAKSAYKKLEASRQKQLQAMCAEKGIVLE
ncbi:MAG: FHA domain-containing protein [Nannocystis sp.]|nr:FHA domain-containing protein [Nannocystis sp.]MBA3549321.1 FHA domain-containing protein [Nannocystis sp.]